MVKQCHKQTRTNNFDSREAWKTEVEPLLEQVYEACEKHGIQCLLWTIQEAHIGDDNKGHITSFLGMHYDHACARSMRYIGEIISGTLTHKSDEYFEALAAIAADLEKNE